MRNRGRSIVKWLVTVATAAGLATALGAAPAGAGTNTRTVWEPKNIELIPPITNDLPTGALQYGPGIHKPDTGGGGGPSTDLSFGTGGWICSIYASNPWKTGYYIQGDGWQSCTGTGFTTTDLKVTIQRYLGLGLWQNKASITKSNSYSAWLEAVPSYYCRGTGNEAYRIVTDGWAVYTRYHAAVQSQNSLRVTC
jgi:hypothetical protein